MNYPWLWLLAQASTGNSPLSRPEQLLDWFNSNPIAGWGLAIFAVVAIAAAAIAKLTGNLDNIIGFVGKYRPKKRELTEADRNRLRQELIDVVLRQVVKRLEDSLHHKIRLDLKRQEERQRVGRRELSPVAQASSGDAVLQRRYRFQPADRLKLIQTLNALPSATFEELMFTLEPPQGQVSGSSASQGNRSRALLEWVEGLNGSGLEKLCDVLEMVGVPPLQMTSTAVEGKALTDVSTYDLLRQDDINGRLLILGEPGAGKTNELLALAKTLLQQAKESADAPIPVIFELSEWSGKSDKTFADWLCEQLQQKYNVPLEVAKDWIEHNQLWPLLDGLDELRRVDDAENATFEEIDRKRQAKQIKCMRAINEFLDLHPTTSAVVCCRRKEYEALETQGEYLKRLNGAIYLQAIDDEQIQTYLEQSNRGALWETLIHQPELLELARSPLFLLMLVVAYQGQPIHNTDELLDLYIENQLNDLNNQSAYPPGQAPSKEQTHHYLTWLATKLEQQELTEFLIERLQPSWLDRARDRRFYQLIFGLSAGLIFGLIGGLNVGLSVGLIFGLSVGLIFGLIFGLIGGLIFRLFFGLIGALKNIRSAENFSFSWRKAMSNVLIFGLIGGLSGGLIFGLSGGLSGGLIFGLSGGLMFGLIGGLIFGLSTSEAEIDDKQLPNQGIKASIKAALIFGLIVGLIFGLIFGLIGGLSGGLMFGLIGGLNGGLEPVIRHGCLRFVLYRSGVSPWNYARFLEHAENHRFIQRVGGRYRFVHDLLRKRFAARYQP